MEKLTMEDRIALLLGRAVFQAEGLAVQLEETKEKLAEAEAKLAQAGNGRVETPIRVEG